MKLLYLQLHLVWRALCFVSVHMLLFVATLLLASQATSVDVTADGHAIEQLPTPVLAAATLAPPRTEKDESANKQTVTRETSIAPSVKESLPKATKPSRGLNSYLWLGLTIAQHGSAAFDAWSTRVSVDSGRGSELDPLMKPFANSGEIYPAIQVVPIGIDFVSHRMMRSSNPFVRRIWWLPQSAASIGFLLSGVSNLRVANH